jgi:hypothetical protein
VYVEVWSTEAYLADLRFKNKIIPTKQLIPANPSDTPSPMLIFAPLLRTLGFETGDLLVGRLVCDRLELVLELDELVLSAAKIYPLT